MSEQEFFQHVSPVILSSAYVVQEYGDKRLTLYDIRDELFAPFKDHRQIFGKMSADEKFTLLTGKILVE